MSTTPKMFFPLILVGLVSSFLRRDSNFLIRKRCTSVQVQSSVQSTQQVVQSLIGREKQQAITALKKILEDDSQHPINVYLRNGTTPVGIGPPVNFYTSVLCTGTFSVLPEINYKCSTGFITGLPPPEIMGGVLRDSGAKGVVVSLHEKSGGVTDFHRFTKEQTSARTFLPGPIPIIWHDVIIDHIQIVHAAALGASAVTLQACYIGQSTEGDLSRMPGFLACCAQHKIEPIVMVASAQEGQEAVKAGARCICLHSHDEAGLLALRDQLPYRQAGSDSQVLYIARLRAEADFSIYEEIDTSWVLRDHGGFDAVWPSPEAVYATGMGDIYPTITAMRSKASREFLSPRQFMMDRKNEGATEYLGDILY